MVKDVIALLVALGLAFGVTIPKLYKMGQIKGWLAGATETTEVITQKWHQTANEHPSERETYWIAWSETDIREIGNHRLNVTQEDWHRVEIGELIEVVSLPTDDHLYLRNGIFVSPENFVFDGVLLVGELTIATIMSIRLARLKK
ncbi:MAG: hypothetical protein AAGG51_18150 [Cyanobacteria bacterium P01_G01_bin.54]